MAAKRTAFETVMWLSLVSKYFGPCVVTKATHSRYELISPYVRRTGNAILARRLKLFTPREEELPVSVFMSDPQNCNGLSECEEEPLKGHEVVNGLNETEQISPEDEEDMESTIATHAGLLQPATLETNSFHVYHRLLGLVRSILEFHPPEVPYRTTVIEAEIMDELPSAAVMFTNYYVMRDPAAVNLLFEICNFYGAARSKLRCSP